MLVSGVVPSIGEYIDRFCCNTFYDIIYVQMKDIGSKE